MNEIIIIMIFWITYPWQWQEDDDWGDCWDDSNVEDEDGDSDSGDDDDEK